MLESNTTEFKTKLNDKLEREVVAFLNYHSGGDIYIGIDDNGNAIGVDDTDRIQTEAADRIKNNILPATLGLFDIIPEKHDGKDVVHIIISSEPEKPYYIRKYGMSPKGCFIRVGSSVQPMEQTMIDTLYSGRIRNSLNNIRSPRTRLTFEQLHIYYQSHGKALNDKFAETLDLLTEDDKYNYIAYLLADSNGTSIKVAKYSGTDKVDLIENEEHGYCSLIKATKSVLDKFEIENRTFARITSKERIEKKLVDPIALREAIINAFVHNDYTREVPPVFEIFSDRIEITSYGGLPDGLSQDDFFGCRSMSRNRELMRIYKDVELVEQLGSGMSRILKAYDKSAFKISDNFLTVIFRFESQAANVIGESANKTGESSNTASESTNALTAAKQKIVEYFADNDRIYTKDAKLLLELSDSRTREILSELVKEGILIKKGKTNGSYYTLNKEG